MNTLNNFIHHNFNNVFRQGTLVLKIWLLLLLVFLLLGCNNNNNQEDINKTPSAILLDEHDRDTTMIKSFAVQRDEYRMRLNKRISDLKEEIETEMRMRKADSDNKEGMERIAQREQRRENFQEWLNKLESQTETGWQNFKSELDELFNRDKNNDTIR